MIFSAAAAMRVRNSWLTLGRPPRGRDRQRPYRRKPARCHPTTVLGFTIARTSDHLGQRCRKAVQKKRSQRLSTGPGRLRLSTAICRRSARTSSAMSTRLRKKTRMAERCEDGRGRQTERELLTRQFVPNVNHQTLVVKRIVGLPVGQQIAPIQIAHDRNVRTDVLGGAGGGVGNG